MRIISRLLNDCNNSTANSHVEPFLVFQWLTKNTHWCIISSKSNNKAHPLSVGYKMHPNQRNLIFQRLFAHSVSLLNVDTCSKEKHTHSHTYKWKSVITHKKRAISNFIEHIQTVCDRADSETCTINQNGNQMHFTMWSNLVYTFSI